MRNSRFALRVVAAATVLSGIGAATPAGALTLEDAVARALRQSPHLEASRARADAAGFEAKGASWARLPRLSAELAALRSDHPVMVFGGLLAQERFSQENFGALDFQTGAFDLSPLNTPDPLTNVRAAVMIRQTLWSGGAVTSGIRAASEKAAAARGEADRTAEWVAHQTEQTFRHAVLAEERLALLRQSLQVAEGQAARVTSMHGEGLALESDRNALLAHVAEARAALMSAEADSAEARSLLGLVLGMDAPVTEPLEAPAAAREGDAPSLADALAAAGRRADVRASEAAWNASRAGKGLARAELFPAFEIAAGAEHNSEEFLGEGGNQWMVSLGARWSFDAGVPQRLRAASAREQAARTQFALARNNAAHEVNAAFSRWQAMRQRELALDAAAAAAAEAYRLVDARHREGLVTTLELTESQNTLTRTRLEAAAARNDAAMARASYLLAAGALLGVEDMQ